MIQLMTRPSMPDDPADYSDSPDNPSEGQPAGQLEIQPPNQPRPARRRRRRAVPDNSVPSPCVAVCQYNSDNVCEGCLRTPDEIRDWIIMSRDEKLAVLEQLALRRRSAAGN